MGLTLKVYLFILVVDVYWNKSIQLFMKYVANTKNKPRHRDKHYYRLSLVVRDDQERRWILSSSHSVSWKQCWRQIEIVFCQMSFQAWKDLWHHFLRWTVTWGHGHKEAYLISRHLKVSVPVLGIKEDCSRSLLHVLLETLPSPNNKASLYINQSYSHLPKGFMATYGLAL